MDLLRLLEFLLILTRELRNNRLDYICKVVNVIEKIDRDFTHEDIATCLIYYWIGRDSGIISSLDFLKKEASNYMQEHGVSETIAFLFKEGNINKILKGYLILKDEY